MANPPSRDETFKLLTSIRLHRDLKPEGRKEGCRVRYSQKWLIEVLKSALETHCVLAEGTHQSRYLFSSLTDDVKRPKVL